MNERNNRFERGRTELQFVDALPDIEIESHVIYVIKRSRFYDGWAYDGGWDLAFTSEMPFEPETIFSDAVPTEDDNVAAGYPVGQWWQVNSTGFKYYQALDGVWIRISKEGQWEEVVTGYLQPADGKGIIIENIESADDNYSTVVLDVLTGKLCTEPIYSRLVDVITNTLGTPPVTPTNGDSYIIGANATGDWLGKTNYIATYDTDHWVFYASLQNDITTILTGINAGTVKYNGVAWVPLVTPVTSWNVTGNATTSTGKIGSVTNQDVAFISNNIVRGLLSKTGKFAFGHSSPVATVDIFGTLRSQNNTITAISDTGLIITGSSGVSLTGYVTPELKGILVGVSGQYLVLRNETGVDITIIEEDLTMTAANRITTGVGDVVLKNNTSVLLICHRTGSRWDLVGNNGQLINGTWRFGSATDYTEIEADGTVKFVGAATVFKDVVVPFNYKGIPAEASLETFVGGIKALKFDVGEYINLENAEAPHDWKEGSGIELHVHWGTKLALIEGDKVQWQLEFCIANMKTNGNVNTIFADPDNPTVFGTKTITAEYTVPVGGHPAGTALYTSFGQVSAATMANIKIGAGWLGVITRIAKSAGGTNPIADTVFGLNVGIHYEVDTIGSRLYSIK